MSGGYGAGGGRGAGGRRGSGYGDDEYDAPGYDETYGGYGGQVPGGQDPAGGQGFGGYRQGSGRARGRGQGGRGQGYDQPAGRPDSRGRWRRGGAGSQQYDPRTGAQPTQRGGGYQPGQRGTGPQPGQPGGRGSGAQPAWRGQGSQQAPDPGTGARPRRGTGPSRQAGGYDPRGTGARRAPDGYPGPGYPGDAYPAGGYQARGDARFGQGEGWDSDPRDDSFVPGFGRRDEFEGGPGPAGAGRGRGGRPAATSGRRDKRGKRDKRGREEPGDSDFWNGSDLPPPRRGPVRRLAPWIALLVVLTPLVIGGLYVYHRYENKYHPADYAGAGTGPTVTVQVKSGDNAFLLAPRLQSLGVIASTRAFENAAEASASTTGLDPGYYKLNHHMQASLAWAALTNPKNRVQLTVTIPEGKRTSQVILKLSKTMNLPLADFQKVVNNPAGLGLPSYAKGKVEGYLFPATYTIEPKETALQIMQAMVQRFKQEAQQDNLVNAARSVNLTPAQVIIEASLAQAEGGSVSDYPKIVRVIDNRLRIGMHLQFDSTVLYGLGKYAVSATIAQTKTPGPYNTYLNAGLTPGPISNPGEAAIHAVLHPATGNWLYFLTKPGGKSEFSATPLAGQ